MTKAINEVPQPRTKKNLLLTCILFMVAATAFAQRNIVEVPSTDIVEYKNFFLQGQTSFMKNEMKSSVIFTYGLGYGWEAGITAERFSFVRGTGLETSKTNAFENPLILVNAQKAFIITTDWKLGVGTQSGITASPGAAAREYAGLHYLNNHFALQHGLHYISFGVYYATDSYAGPGTNVGVMGGFEVAIVKERLNFQLDFITGNNDLSVINAGLEFAIGMSIHITAGVQMPVPGSDNMPAALLQIAFN